MKRTFIANPCLHAMAKYLILGCQKPAANFKILDEFFTECYGEGRNTFPALWADFAQRFPEETQIIALSYLPHANREIFATGRGNNACFPLGFLVFTLISVPRPISFAAESAANAVSSNLVNGTTRF